MSGFGDFWKGLAMFDYGSMEKGAVGPAQRAARMIKDALSVESNNTMMIGMLLTSVREKTTPKLFREWFFVEFGWTMSVASNFMRAYAMFRDVDQSVLKNIGRTALFMLARTDRGVVTAMLNLAKRGNPVSTLDVSNAIEMLGVSRRHPTAGVARKARTAKQIVEFLRGVIQTASKSKLTPKQRSQIVRLLEETKLAIGDSPVKPLVGSSMAGRSTKRKSSSSKAIG